MMTRCNNPKGSRFEDYGGRGISVCDRWKKFELFLEDMGHASPGLTIERKDTNGNYCKDNCRWATRTEQARNKRNNVNITIGNDTKTYQEWSVVFGVPKTTICQRLQRGWDKVRAVTEKPKVTGTAVVRIPKKNHRTERA